MTNEKIAKILEMHCINYTAGKDNTIWAAEAYTVNGEYHEDMINVTGWSKTQLLNWLGY